MKTPTIYTSFLEHGHVLFTTNKVWPTLAGNPRWKAKRSAVIPPSGSDVLDDTVRWVAGLEGDRPLAYFEPEEML